MDVSRIPKCCGVGLPGVLALAAALISGSCKKQAEDADRRGAATRADKRKRQAGERKGEDAPAAARPAPSSMSAESMSALQGLAKAPAKASRRARRGATLHARPQVTGTSEGLAASDKKRKAFRSVPVVSGKRIPDMYFKHYGVNPTIDTEEEHVSTFAADVDTASYTLAAGYLRRNAMPPEAAIRVEEFINAFDYGYRAPGARGAPFTLRTALLPSPNRRGYHVLHVGLRGREVASGKRLPAHLTFVVDASATMKRAGRLDLVKRSLTLLVGQLRKTDRVTIVTFGTRAQVLLRATAGHRHRQIRAAIGRITAGGSANASAGLALGFRLAARDLKRGGTHRVILCSDGVANSGVTDVKTILAGLRAAVSRGLTLTAVGFGMGGYDDRLMEQLARGANGNYYYVDQLAQARRIFVEQLTGTLQLVARDLKLQVLFDKQVVSRYRLLGYESRMLKGRGFRASRTDAGELGAGQSVTALYEVKLRGKGRKPLGRLRVRYKTPAGSVARQVERALPRADTRLRFAGAAPEVRLSVVVAAFAEKLRGSYWVRNLGYPRLLALHAKLGAKLSKRADVVALGKLIRAAARLDRRGDKFAQTLPISRMTFDRVPVLR